MSNDVIVNLKAVQADTDWKLVAATACRHEAGAQALGKVGDSIYGWARRQATIVQAEVVEKLKAAGKEYNPLAARGAFENSKLVVDMEAYMRSPSCPHSVGEGKLPRSWTQAKSDLCNALEHGLMLADDPEISQQNVKKFNKAANDRKKQEQTQAALKEFAEAGGHIAEAPKPNDKSQAAPAAQEGQPQQANDPAPAPQVKIETHVLGVNVEHLSDEQLERITAILEGWDAIAEAGMTDKLNNLITTAFDQSKQRVNAALAKLGRKAA